MKCHQVKYMYSVCPNCKSLKDYKEGVIAPPFECPHYTELNKEPNMSEKIAVHVPNRYLWEAVEKNERERGVATILSPSSCWMNYGKESCFGLGKSDTYSSRQYYCEYGYEIITVDEYFKRYGEKPEPPIKIGTYEVKNIDKEGFNVGCQRVSWETFDKIGAKRPKE